MCVLVIKKDSEGRPIGAKSRIVVLGNLESTPWTKVDCFALVVAHAENRRILKQADAKNALCQPTLPDNEVVVV
jgi:hypothetical protein